MELFVIALAPVLAAFWLVALFSLLLDIRRRYRAKQPGRFQWEP